MKLLRRGADRLHLPDAPRRDRGARPLPECGMKLLPAQLVGQAAGGTTSTTTTHAMHEGHEHAATGHGHDHAAAGGIEWEDDMVDVNRITTPANTRWKLIDRSDRRREPRHPVAVHASATG